MTSKFVLAAGLLLAFAGAAQAQTCPCDSSATTRRTVDQTALATLLAGRMACGVVGSEKWQEWHNGSSSGAIVDYKLGPTNTRDPSTNVGSYTVTVDNTVVYNYGPGASYTYDVCYVASGNTYTFCGAKYGGRNITGVRIGGGGLANCDTVANSPLPPVPPPPPTTTTNARTVKR